MSRPPPPLHLTLTALCLILSAYGAPARAADSRMGLDLKLGTLALGGDVVVKVNEAVNVRLGYTGFSRRVDFTENSVNYRGDARLSSPSLLVDWALVGGDCRVTAGAIAMKSHVDAIGHPSSVQTYTIGNSVYSTNDISSLTGRAEFGNSVAPYLGFGWGNLLKSKGHWSWVADLGVVYAGSPSVTLSAPCAPDASVQTCSALQADLALERENTVQDIMRLKWYPVANLGVGYRF